MSEEAKKVISLEELKQHSNRDDLWLAINGKIYDVSGFVDEHPGGEEVLLDEAGKDATEAFDDVGHSEYASELLTDMYVGEGNPEELVTVKQKPQTVDTSSSTQGGGANVGLIFLAVVVAGVAYFYFKANQ